MNNINIWGQKARTARVRRTVIWAMAYNLQTHRISTNKGLRAKLRIANLMGTKLMTNY